MLSNLNPFLAHHTFYILKHAPYIFKFMLKNQEQRQTRTQTVTNAQTVTKINVL